MHVENLSSPIKELLRNAGTTLTTKVMIEVVTLQAMPNGSFGPAYARYRFDVSDRLIGDPQLSMQKSRWPDDIDFIEQTIEMSLSFTNSDRLFAVAQTGAILRSEDIEQAKVDIYANVGGNLVNWFSGRVTQRPKEEAGKTTLTISGFLWECARNQVLYENFGTVQNGPKSEVQSVSGGEAGFVPTTVHVPCVGSHFCVHHGLVVFDGGGNAKPRLKKLAGTTIELLSMRLANRLKLGKYSIKFTSHAGYTLICPDNTIYSGNRFKGLPADSPIQIDPSYWVGEDGQGCEIEFWVNWTAKGSGISMAYHLLEKGLLANQGVLPNNPAARLDVAAFTFWATRFRGFEVYVDATNEDNSVFDGKTKNRPLSYMALAQKILMHYQCSLTVMIDGTISIIGPYMDDRPTWPHATDAAIVTDTIVLEGGESINYVRVNFGGDVGGGLATPILRDLNPNAVQRVEKVFTLPWIKVGRGSRFALWWEKTIVRRFLERQTTISYKVDRGHGLLLAVGDRVKVQSNVLPVVNQNCEIVSVNRGIDLDGTVTAAMVQSGEGAAALVGVSEVGGFGVW